MGVLPEYMHEHHMCAWFPQFPWNWSHRGCDLPCGFWELNVGPLKRQ